MGKGVFADAAIEKVFTCGFPPVVTQKHRYLLWGGRGHKKGALGDRAPRGRFESITLLEGWENDAGWFYT